MDRERPQARRRPTRSLLPPGPRCSHRADWLLPVTRHAVRDQCGERLDPPRRDRRVGTTGSRTANTPDRLKGQRSPEVIRTSALRAVDRADVRAGPAEVTCRAATLEARSLRFGP